MLLNPDCCLTRMSLSSRKEYSLVLSSLSVSLLRQLVRLIGLYLSGSLDILSFFGIIIILAFFHLSGIPEAIDRFTRRVKTDLT